MDRRVALRRGTVENLPGPALPVRLAMPAAFPSRTAGLTETSGFRNLAIELYDTGRSCHVFDARRVVFIAVDRNLFDVLQVLRDRETDAEGLRSALPRLSAREVRAALGKVLALQRQGYLLRADVRRQSPYSRPDFQETLTRRLPGFTVHVTTQCNLACSYCIYGGGYDRHEKLSRTAMSWETARNMVDFLLGCSRESAEVRLDFFGGEPLLAFDLIRRTVEYADASLGPPGPGKPSLTVTIASNGTVLRDDVLDFLVRHHVALQFSIDGSEEVHDRARRFRNGRGSHAVVLRNLDRIHRRAPAYFREQVRVKCVISPESLEGPDDGFLLHPLIRTIADDGHLDAIVKEPRYDAEGDAPYFEAIARLGAELAERTGVRTLSELIRPLTFRQKAFFHDTFEAFLDAQATNAFYFGTSPSVTFTKGCLLGAGESSVLPSGDIVVCQKATSFVIGNVNRGGWDLDRIWELQSRLYAPWDACASCFAARFCDLCHEKLDGASESAGRERFCEFTRRKHHVAFRWMLRILERNPGLWVDFGKVVRDRMREMATANEEGRSRDVASRRELELPRAREAG